MMLPETVTDPQAFQAGYAYGEQAAINDMAAHGSATDEELAALVERLGMRQGIMPTDWYAGMLCGYRVTRSLA